MRPDHSMFWQVRVCASNNLAAIIASVDKDVKESHDKFDEWQIPSIAFLCFNVIKIIASAMRASLEYCVFF